MTDLASAYARGAAGGSGEAPTHGWSTCCQVAAPQQVMLEVKVAEVRRPLVDQLGASLDGSQHQRQLDLQPAV